MPGVQQEASIACHYAGVRTRSLRLLKPNSHALASCLPIVVASSRTKPLFDLGGSPSQTPVQGADTPYERMKIRSSRVDIAVVFSSYPLADLGNPRWFRSMPNVTELAGGIHTVECIHVDSPDDDFITRVGPSPLRLISLLLPRIVRHWAQSADQPLKGSLCARS